MQNLAEYKVKFTSDKGMTDAEFIEFEKELDKFQDQLQEFVEERFANAFKENVKKQFGIKVEVDF